MPGVHPIELGSLPVMCDVFGIRVQNASQDLFQLLSRRKIREDEG